MTSIMQSIGGFARRARPAAPMAALAALLLAAASPAVVGPPWISIEYPPSPYDRVTREAYLLVHSYHHFTPVGLPVSGTAEGIVAGQRKSVKLSFVPTSKEGVFALNKQWQDNGTWMLVISVTQGKEEGNTVTALVEIGTNGQVASVKVPTRKEGNYIMPKVVTTAEIESALKLRAGEVAHSGSR
jgi:hypothetical protein